MLYYELNQDLSKLNLLYVKETEDKTLKFTSPEIDYPLDFKGFETMFHWFEKVLKYHSGE